jgi:hypothetical protein
MYIGLHVKYRCACQILMKLEFFDRFSKNIQISNFMKVRPVAAKLFRADGRRDIHEAKRRFSSFCEERLKIEPLPRSKHILFPLSKSIVKAIYEKNGCCSNNNSVEIKTVWLKLDVP